MAVKSILLVEGAWHIINTQRPLNFTGSRLAPYERDSTTGLPGRHDTPDTFLGCAEGGGEIVPVSTRFGQRRGGMGRVPDR